MVLPLCLAFFLLAQPTSDLSIRETAAGQIEVSAALTRAQEKLIPPGKLTAKEGEAWLRFTLLDATTGKAGPAMLGNYRRMDTELIFRPRFGVEAGRTYRAFFGSEGGPLQTRDYHSPLPKGGATPVIVKIYPSADILPANVLRFTIHFSQPMRGGKEIFDQIQILDAEGNVISDAWLMDELWDQTGQILIIYIHPGRIKWGVVLRDVLGPVLLPGRDYTLVLRGALADANGQTLGKEVLKRFRTTAEDRTRINLNDWQVQAPTPGSSMPLVVRFATSLDHKALERFLTVQDDKGAPVVGSMTIGRDEKTWSFAPARPWLQTEYRLCVNGRLEDVAGNTPRRPFDMDLKAPAPPAQRLEIPFVPH